jgi:hypothetical protein
MATDIHDFGDELIRTRDLDPVYVAIHGAQLPRAQLCRLLSAYWCFYHLGAAAWLSEHEGDAFWSWMLTAAENSTLTPHLRTRWPRAAERRHFRGQAAVRTIDWLRQEAPEYWVESLSDLDTDEAVMRAVRGWPLHGDWVAFKAADMLERCAGQRITFSGDLGLVYREPRAGLDMLAQDGESTVVHYGQLLEHFGRHLAPPGMDRPCSFTETETVLCKWKSHAGGRYAVGKDIREVRHALVGWGETADRMLRAAPEEVAHG